MATFEHLGNRYPIAFSIVQHLSKEDLLAFRLATLPQNYQLIHRVASTRFAREYFTRLNVFMSRKSLSMLKDICAHPIFSRHIKFIGFASSRLITAGVQNYKYMIEDLAASSNPAKRELIDEATKALASYSLLWAEQHAICSSGEALKLFTEALELVAKQVNLGVSDRVHTHLDTNVLGSRFCYHYVPNGITAYESCRDSTFKLVLYAAAVANCEPRSFTVDLNDSWVSRGDTPNPLGQIEQGFYEDVSFGGRITSDNADRLQLVQLSSHLQRLVLRWRESVYQHSRTSAEPIRDLISYAHRLEVLETHVSEGHERQRRQCPMLDQLLATAYAPQLHTFRLDGFDDSKDSLIMFLAKHKELRSVELRNCQLETARSWIYVFSTAVKTLHLQTLVMENLSYQLELPYWIPLHCSIRCVVERSVLRTSEISSGLDQVISTVVLAERGEPEEIDRRVLNYTLERCHVE